MKLRTEVVEILETDILTGKEKEQIHFTDDRRHTVCGIELGHNHRWVFQDIFMHTAFQTHSGIECLECQEYAKQALGFFSTPINRQLGLNAPTEVDQIIDAFQIEALHALFEDGDIRRLEKTKVDALFLELLNEFNPDNTEETRNRIIARNLNRVGDTLIKVDYGKGEMLTTINEMLWAAIVEYGSTRIFASERESRDLIDSLGQMTDSLTRRLIGKEEDEDETND